MPPRGSIRLAGQRMTKEGVIVIHAQRFRTQERNRADAIDRLLELLQEAMVRPVPRRATKPTFGSKQRRLEGKKRRSDIKAGRGSRGYDDRAADMKNSGRRRGRSCLRKAASKESAAASSALPPVAESPAAPPRALGRAAAAGAHRAL